MKKKLNLITVSFAICGLVSGVLFAETSVTTNNISASATISSVNNLTTALLNIADDLSAAGLAFGSVSSGGKAWNTLPGQYVKTTVEDNSVAWRLRVYSDNYVTAPSTSAYGFSYGGLKGVVNGSKVPMGWMCLPNTVPGGPGVGDPSTGTLNGWTYFKDAHDVDDPSTTGTGKDESFGAADAAGYTNIAFGAPSYTRVIRPNISGGSEQLPTTATPFYVYLEGDFSSSAATSYSGTIKLELLNQ